MKNTIIGFLMATCMFLMIGASEEVESMEMFVDGQVSVECEAPKYQAFGDGYPLHMINTETGELYKKAPLKKKKPWVKLSGADWVKE